MAYGLDIKSLAKHAFYFRYHDGREDGLYRNTDYGDQCYTEDTSHFSTGLQANLETECSNGFDEGYNETCHLATKATESTDPDHVSGCSIPQYNQRIYEKNGVIYSDNIGLGSE